MAKLCKRMKALNAKVEANKLYTAVEALELIKETAVAKFDESVDVAVQLGIDPRKSDQAVRGAVVMPEGTGKTVRVAVFTQAPRLKKLLPPAPISSVSTTSPPRSRPVSSTSTSSSPPRMRCALSASSARSSARAA